MGSLPVRLPPAVGPVDFTTVFERELAYVWNALRRMGVAARDLEDVTQQVFMAVHARFADYDGQKPLRPWLFGFALLTASNYRRLARHRLELTLNFVEPSDPAPGADEQLVAQELRQIAEAALQTVELERRGVLILHDVEGHSVPEIAEALGLRLNTAYSRLRLARQDFQRAYVRLNAQQRGAR